MFTKLIAGAAQVGVQQQSYRFKTYVLILVMIVANPLGNVLLRRGMKHVGGLGVWSPPALVHTGLTIFATASIWLGISALFAFFISYMLVLSWADYTFVQPLSSVAYGVSALFGYLILGEKVSPLRWMGIAIICAGVFIVGRTTPRTTTREMMEET